MPPNLVLKNVIKMDIKIIPNLIIMETKGKINIKGLWYFMKIRKMVLAALFAALCCVSTAVIQVPTPTNGYIHIGDGFVLMCGFLLGPYYGFFAAAIGSALADAVTGYFIYVPGTFIIKGVVALAACLMYKKIKSVLACSLIAEVIMVVGYYFYAVILTSNFVSSLSGIPTNVLQGVVGAVLATILVKLLTKNDYLKKMWE